MTALSANAPNLKTQPAARTRTFQVKNSQAMYVGGLCGLDSGYLVPWSDTAGLQFLGIFEGFEPAITDDGVLATTGDTANEPDIRGIVDVSGPYLYGVDVTGVSAITSLGANVFGPDDNYATPSLTGTVNVGKIGWLADFRSATDMDVKLLTPEQYMAQEGGGGAVPFQIEMTNIADGDIVTGWTPGFAGRIIGVEWVQGEPVTTASDLSTLNFEIGTTNLTGGVISLTSATCTPLGAVIAGTAITAGNNFGKTDTISIEASSTTSFAEGDGMVVIRYVAY